MYREFTLRDNNVWNAFKALVTANAKSFADNGSPLRIILTSEERKRNNEQNKKLHAMLAHLSQNAWVNGRTYPAEFWKEYYRRRYLLKDEYSMPSGEIVQVYWSTADLSVKRFSELIEQIYVDGATDYAIEWNF